MIEIQNVSYAYEDAAAKALNNVSLTINDGEFVAVVGHNVDVPCAGGPH